MNRMSEEKETFEYEFLDSENVLDIFSVPNCSNEINKKLKTSQNETSKKEQPPEFTRISSSETMEDKSTPSNIIKSTKTYSKKKIVSLSDLKDSSNCRLKLNNKLQTNDIKKKLFFNNVPQSNFLTADDMCSPNDFKKSLTNETNMPIKNCSKKLKKLTNGGSPEKKFNEAKLSAKKISSENGITAVRNLNKTAIEGYARTRKNLQKIKCVSDTEYTDNNDFNFHSSLKNKSKPQISKIIESNKCSETSKEQFSISSLISNSSTTKLKRGESSESKKKSSSDKGGMSLMDMVRRFSSKPTCAAAPEKNSWDQKYSIYNKSPLKKTTQETLSSVSDSKNLEDYVSDIIDTNDVTGTDSCQNLQSVKHKNSSSNISMNQTLKYFSEKLNKLSNRSLAPNLKKKSISKSDMLRSVNVTPIKVEVDKSIGKEVAKNFLVDNCSVYSSPDKNSENDTGGSRSTQKAKRKRNSSFSRKTKKMKKTKCSNSVSVEKVDDKFSTNDVYNPSFNNNVNIDISSWLDAEMEKANPALPAAQEYFAQDQNIKSNSVSNKETSNNNFESTNTVNLSSGIQSFSMPSTALSTCFTPEINTSLTYINPLVPSLQPFVQNSATVGVFFIPVPCNSCSRFPTSLPPFNVNDNPLPAIVKFSSNESLDTIFDAVKKNFYYPSTQRNAINMGNDYSQMSINNVFSSSTSICNTPRTQPVDITENFEISCNETSENFGSEKCKINSDSGPEMCAMSSTDRSVVFLDHFCELMKIKTKMTLLQCKEESNNMFNHRFSFPNHLSVKQFFRNADVDDFLSNFCSRSSYSYNSAYKVSDHFEETSLNILIKDYIIFHIKEILKALPQRPFNATLSLIFKAENSKLNIAEKYIFKKIFCPSKNIGIEDLIGGLFFVGLIAMFNEFKQRNMQTF